MDARQVSRSAWLQIYILGASALLILIAVGNLLLFTRTLSFSSRGAPLETALMLTGVFVALPLGVLNISLGWSGLKVERAAAGRTIAIAGLVAGVLGILTGSFWYGALIYLLTGGFR